ncbi:RDD family protein [Pararhizobium polonicum]|nr:RDD family protein [Pararhizobium polonicum]
MTIWYYKLGTEQAGPVSADALLELAKSGAVKPDTLVWHAGMTAWEKAAKTSELELSFPEMLTDIAPIGRDLPLAGPWERLWARLLDVYIFTLVLGGAAAVLADLYMPSFLVGFFNLPGVLLDIIFLPFAGLAAAAIMRITGTTIGKAIVGIKVRRLSGPNTLPFLLKREFKVWIFGLGIGLPLINLITMINQHRHISKTGSAGYDQGVAQVTSRGSLARCSVAALAFAAILFSAWHLEAIDKSAADDVKITREWTNPATGGRTVVSKTWTFKELKAEFGSTFHFSSSHLLAEMVLGYEPLDQDNIDPFTYGEALQEVISEDLRVTSEWKPVEVAGIKSVRATAVHKTAADTNVEITVTVVGRSAWRLFVFVRGQPADQFIEGKAAAQSLFLTIKDINLPTDLPCGDGRCV